MVLAVMGNMIFTLKIREVGFMVIQNGRAKLE